MRVRIVLWLLMGLWMGVERDAAAHPWGGLVVDAQGRIYFSFTYPMVGDDHLACVWRLTPGADAPEPLLQAVRSPSDMVLARDPLRRIYAAERDGSDRAFVARLWHLRPAGDRELRIPPTSDPAEFAIQAYTVTSDSTLYFAFEDRLYRRRPDGEVTAVAGGGPEGRDGQGAAAGFTRIGAMASGPDDAVYVLDRGRLAVLDASGRITTRARGLRLEDPEHLPWDGANLQMDLAVDAAGNAYVAYYGNRQVLRVTPGGEVSVVLQAEGPWAPHGVDVHDGVVYVLESTTPGRWWRFWQRDVLRPRVRRLLPDGRVETVYEHDGRD